MDENKRVNNVLMEAALSYLPKRVWTNIESTVDYDKEKKAPSPNYYKVVVAQCRDCGATERVIYSYVWRKYSGRFIAQLDDMNEPNAEVMTEVIRVNTCDLCQVAALKWMLANKGGD